MVNENSAEEIVQDSESGDEVIITAKKAEGLAKRDSRFLYVDVASRRAKQLRRGALPRLKELEVNPATGERPEIKNKLERIAMEEVNDGLIAYELPEPTKAD